MKNRIIYQLLRTSWWWVCHIVGWICRRCAIFSCWQTHLRRKLWWQYIWRCCRACCRLWRLNMCCTHRTTSLLLLFTLQSTNRMTVLMTLNCFLAHSINKNPSIRCSYLVVTPVVIASTMHWDWVWLDLFGFRELRVRWRDFRNNCL